MAGAHALGVLIIGNRPSPEDIVTRDPCIDVEVGCCWDGEAGSEKIRVLDETPLVNPVGFPTGDLPMESVARNVIDRLSVDDPESS